MPSFLRKAQRGVAEGVYYVRGFPLFEQEPHDLCVSSGGGKHERRSADRGSSALTGAPLVYQGTRIASMLPHDAAYISTVRPWSSRPSAPWV